ncbi:DUF4271 domain-containing protein [bacterium]|nr:DUF4271 domain-containing protein [bacterium]
MIYLSDLIGKGEVIDRVHDLDKSINFLKMILFLSFIVFARLINPSIFQWLYRQVLSIDANRDYNAENPEKYVLSISMLLIFSVMSVGVFLAQQGAYNDFSNPVLVNMLVTLFFFTVFLVLVNVLQTALFRIGNVLNRHFIDLLSYLFIVGAGAFVALLAKWFLNEGIAGILQSAVIVFLVLFFLFRMLRLMVKGSLIFGQNVILIFFYLCAAEISPFLIVGKLLINLV